METDYSYSISSLCFGGKRTIVEGGIAKENEFNPLHLIHVSVELQQTVWQGDRRVSNVDSLNAPGLLFVRMFFILLLVKKQSELYNVPVISTGLRGKKTNLQRRIIRRPKLQGKKREC